MIQLTGGPSGTLRIQSPSEFVLTAIESCEKMTMMVETQVRELYKLQLIDNLPETKHDSSLADVVKVVQMMQDRFHCVMSMVADAHRKFEALGLRSMDVEEVMVTDVTSKVPKKLGISKDSIVGRSSVLKRY
jgi:hypothetical protein